jgi:hypothetical protein
MTEAMEEPHRRGGWMVERENEGGGMVIYR